MQLKRSHLCQCGCGQPARRRFIRGHNDKTPANPRPDYVVEDRGHSTPCWTWQKYLTQKGYGTTSRDGKTFRAHRLYYEDANGPIPAGLQLDHLCRNRACVNPEHLEPVTGTENARRAAHLDLATATLVRWVRTTTTLTQLEAADMCGIDPARVWAIEKGLLWRVDGGIA